MSYVIFYCHCYVTISFIHKACLFQWKWGCGSERTKASTILTFTVDVRPKFFHYKSLPFYFHYVRHLHTVFTAFCVCFEHKTTLWVSLPLSLFRDLCVVTKNQLSHLHSTAHYSTYSYDDSFDGVHYNAWKYHVDIYGIYYANILSLSLLISRVCVYAWEISLYSHWLLCRWCYDSVLKM